MSNVTISEVIKTIEKLVALLTIMKGELSRLTPPDKQKPNAN